MDPTNVYRIMDAFGQQEDEQQENAASSGLSGHMVDTLNTSDLPTLSAGESAAQLTDIQSASKEILENIEQTSSTTHNR
ncbi:hypothetical protein [Candidatus Ichthyocystis sparus]|uniref:hypothetical protein n=1 Tax=Candidatus Ichthyocystis sparus TaxID=1561004 RepID=UPI000B84AE13|nr:hypothetical protein [Candidatus Ichthyocystis sparus]